jgi:hypothetical protein
LQLFNDEFIEKRSREMELLWNNQLGAKVDDIALIIVANVLAASDKL